MDFRQSIKFGWNCVCWVKPFVYSIPDLLLYLVVLECMDELVQNVQKKSTLVKQEGPLRIGSKNS